MTPHIVVDGAGEPSVLVCTGLGDASFTWDAVTSLLAPSHRVVRFDRPGLGDSPPAVLLPTLHGEVERISGIVGTLDMRGPVIVAHSAAALYAEAYARLHPDGLSALLLIDPTTDPSVVPRRLADALPRPGTLARLLTPIARLAGPAVWAAAIRHMTDGSTPLDHAHARRVYGSGSTAAAILGEWWAYSAMMRDLIRLRAGTSAPQTPVVIVTALGDRHSKRRKHNWQQDHARLTASFPGGRQVVLPASGHLVHFDDPAAIATAVTSLAN